MRRSRPPAPAPVPFSPQAARAHRTGLGLTPEQVAAAMAAHGVRLLPGHVLGWESGEIIPGEEEFIALARALWCPPVQLMGTRPATLRDFRLARELSQQHAATRIGMGLRSYAAAELTGRWTGDPEQAAALVALLGMTLREFVRVTGGEGELADLLRRCVAGRWQAHLPAVARLVPVPPARLTGALTALQAEHQVPSHWGSTTQRTAPPPPSEPHPERFWALLAEQGTGGLAV
ncbi:transcriptional regulator [Kitasatospora sp. NPDC006697]|uniref:helix-turn-helix domain-containing protein n=1 Tax=Kitasatospora sp. NPDC006697 TaxID=3364020 RepID=UPI00367DDF70